MDANGEQTRGDEFVISTTTTEKGFWDERNTFLC